MQKEVLTQSTVRRRMEVSKQSYFLSKRFGLKKIIRVKFAVEHRQYRRLYRDQRYIYDYDEDGNRILLDMCVSEYLKETFDYPFINRLENQGFTLVKTPDLLKMVLVRKKRLELLSISMTKRELFFFENTDVLDKKLQKILDGSIDS